MGKPAARRGDQVTALDVHDVVTATAVRVPTPTPFSGVLDGGLSTNVTIMGSPAAVVGSTATNTPPHVPTGGTFARPPSNRGTVVAGSATVLINGKPAARAGDKVRTCNDPTDLPVGTVVAAGTVLIG